MSDHYHQPHRYIPQYPRPRSAPQTPSPASPEKLDVGLASAQPTHIDTTTTAASRSYTSFGTSPVSSGSTQEAITPITPLRVTLDEDHDAEAALVGMGITIPADEDRSNLIISNETTKPPQPPRGPTGMDMSRSRSDQSDPDLSRLSTSTCSPMTPWSTGSPSQQPYTTSDSQEYGSLQASSRTTIRSRSSSPEPDRFASSSSSSLYSAPQSSSYRERNVSPNKAAFFQGNRDELLPRLDTGAGGNVSTYNALLNDTPTVDSPAIDGKKEPSIKPAPHTHDAYDPSLYARPHNARIRSTYQSGSISFSDSHTYPNNHHVDEKLVINSIHTHPLTAPLVYNYPTMDSEKPSAKYTESTAYWLGLYFFFNLGLTLFNKIVLVSFPFPYVSDTCA